MSSSQRDHRRETNADQDVAPRERRNSVERMREALENPGTVKINVKGAFIVDDEESEATDEEKTGDSGDGRRRQTTSPKARSPQGRSKDIRLPHHTDVVSHVAVDIGGSLAKVVYFTKEVHSAGNGGRLNFVNFETSDMEECIAFVRRLHELHHKDTARPNRGEGDGRAGPSRSRNEELCVVATGGGSFKYYDRLKQELGVDIQRGDEMQCLITGLDFFLTEIPNEIFTYETPPFPSAAMSTEKPPPWMQFAPARPDLYPYLLVNIGSGVSLVKVTGPNQYTRVGGTSLGGGTFWGLASLLSGVKSFDEMLEMADRGNNAGVDLLVGDIYGRTYEKMGLDSSIIASSFGKVLKEQRRADDAAAAANSNPGSGTGGESSGDSETTKTEELFGKEDICRSLLFAISYNIGQIAYLVSEKHNVHHIYFGGSFIRGHSQTMNTLSFAIRYWSNGEKQAYFLRHEGYLGAVGAFLQRQPRNWGRKNSVSDLKENVKDAA